jgi:general secretion pathway protein I
MASCNSSATTLTMRADPLHSPASRQRGFTLLEVMVALAVIAFALAAAVSAVSGNSRNAAGLQQRTYAHWVAMNKMVELRISQQWPATRTTKGSALMARHEWFWSMKVSKTPNIHIRRVDIMVRPNEDDESPLVTLTGFVGRPAT